MYQLVTLAADSLLKAHFLTEPEPPFALIETLRWEKGCGYTLLDRHLASSPHRLATSRYVWTNLFIRRGGRLLTPPVACGFLDGTLRQELLATRPDEVAEAVLRHSDLADAEAVLHGNSVRGLMPARPTSVGIHRVMHPY